VSSYGRIQQIIGNAIESRRAAKKGGACSPEQEDLLGMLLRLQEEDSLAFPLTSEIIGTVMFVSIIYLFSNLRYYWLLSFRKLLIYKRAAIAQLEQK